MNGIFALEYIQQKDVLFISVLLQIEIEIGVTQLQKFDSSGMTSPCVLLVPLFLCEQHFSTDGVGSYAFKARSHIYITAPQAALCLLNERISLLLENISGRG